MKFVNVLKINQRQNKTLLFQLTALFISWICCYFTNFTFGVFTLTEILVAGALIYSNEGFLKYKLSRCVLITVVLVALFSVFQSIIPWVLIWFISADPIIISSVCSYILITVVLEATQKQVKIGLFQMLTVAVLLLVYFIFFYNNPAFGYSLKGYHIPFFINQFFVIIYAVSTFASVNEEALKSILAQEETPVNSFRTKNIYKFLKFTILALVGVGILFLIFLIVVIDMWGGFTHPKDEMISDFEANTNVFYDIRKYMNMIDPEHKIREIDFDIFEDKLFYITINGIDATNGYSNMKSWKPSDSLLRTTPWTKKSFTVLKEELDKVKCESIKTGEPFVIGHKPINAQRLYYNLFKNIADHFPYNDTCRYMRYNDTLILEFKHISQYDSECFPN